MSDVGAEDVTAAVTLADILPVDLVTELSFENRGEILRRVTVFLVSDELNVGAFDGVLEGFDGLSDYQISIGSVFRLFEVCRPSTLVGSVGDRFGTLVAVVRVGCSTSVSDIGTVSDKYFRAIPAGREQDGAPA
jgi:hypothetical protein